MRVAQTPPPHAVPGRPRRRRRGGAAAVELAIVLPFILALLLGLWEFGRMAEVEQILSTAAREGGRQASTGQKSAAQVQAVVTNYLLRAGLKQGNGQPVTATVTVTAQPGGSPVDPSQSNQLDHLRITVSIPFDQVRWVLLSQGAYNTMLGGTRTTTLTASADWYSMQDTPVNVTPIIPVE